MSQARVGEIERRMSNIVRPGTVLETDYSNARIKVQCGGNQTAWIPWITSRAGGDRTWHAPEVGEQVVVLAPSGDLAQGYVLPGGVYKNDRPAPADTENISGTTYADGAVITYDREAHSHVIQIPSGGQASVQVGNDAQTEILTNKITHRIGNTKIEITANSIKLTCGSSVFELTPSGTTLTTPQFSGSQS